MSIVAHAAHDLSPQFSFSRVAITGNGRPTSLRLERADRISGLGHLVRLDIDHVLILIFGHLAQELLELAAAFLAHTAFKLG